MPSHVRAHRAGGHACPRCLGRDACVAARCGGRATGALRATRSMRSGLEFRVAEGEGVVHGPKVDFHFRDRDRASVAADHRAVRLWPARTVPDGATLGEDNQASPAGDDASRDPRSRIQERFSAVLIERYASAFPLAGSRPSRCVLLLVADRHLEHARELASWTCGARGAASRRGRQRRGRSARRSAPRSSRRLPYVLVMGDKEIETGEPHRSGPGGRRGRGRAVRGLRGCALVDEAASSA